MGLCIKTAPFANGAGMNIMVMLSGEISGITCIMLLYAI